LVRALGVIDLVERVDLRLELVEGLRDGLLVQVAGPRPTARPAPSRL
jgi:hypothetical protein